MKEHEVACVPRYLSEGICVSEKKCVLKRGVYRTKGVERMCKMNASLLSLY